MWMGEPEQHLRRQLLQPSIADFGDIPEVKGGTIDMNEQQANHQQLPLANTSILRSSIKDMDSTKGLILATLAAIGNLEHQLSPIFPELYTPSQGTLNDKLLRTAIDDFHDHCALVVPSLLWRAAASELSGKEESMVLSLRRKIHNLKVVTQKKVSSDWSGLPFARAAVAEIEKNILVLEEIFEEEQKIAQDKKDREEKEKKDRKMWERIERGCLLLFAAVAGSAFALVADLIRSAFPHFF